LTIRLQILQAQQPLQVLLGVNTIVGAGAADTITGGSAADILTGANGADTIDGGAGLDTFTTASMVGSGVATTGIEGNGTGTSTGVVVNLSSSSLTSSTINTATTQHVAGTLGEIASGKAAYLFNTSDNSFSTVLDTLVSIENVTLSGNGINYVVGSAEANVIVGGTGVDTIVGGLGADTITGGAGIDVITLTETTQSIDTVSMTGVTIVANRDVITGFTSSTDKIALDIDYTSVATAAAAAAVTQTSAIVQLGAAGAFNLAALAATNTKDLYILTGGNQVAADLSAATDGSELFKLLGDTGQAATSLTVTAGGELFYVAAFDAGNTYIYAVTETANTAATAAEIHLIATLTGTSAVVAGDFVMIA